MDVRNIQKIMKQMSTEELGAERVEIFMEDGRKITVNKPNVVKMQIMGQTNFQISGEISESLPSPAQLGAQASTEEDIKLVSESSGATIEEAKKALAESNGDIASAIMKLKGTVYA